MSPLVVSSVISGEPLDRTDAAKGKLSAMSENYGALRREATCVFMALEHLPTFCAPARDRGLLTMRLARGIFTRTEVNWSIGANSERFAAHG